MNQETTWNVSIPQELAGKRIDAALARAAESGLGSWDPEVRQGISRSQLTRLISEGRASLNHQSIDNPSLKVIEGDHVQVRLPAPRSMDIRAEEGELEILFEDEHIAVVNKPAGISTHPSPAEMEGTLVHLLLGKLKSLSGIGGVLRPGIVHRLDKFTSGALVISKTDEAHQKLSETFKTHDIERIYWAYCYGAPPHSSEQTIRSTLGRNPQDRLKMAMNVKNGKEAITHYKKLMNYSRGHRVFASLIQARLETGRTHQVRVHLTSMGCSLLGDAVYGTPSVSQPKWKALPHTVQEVVRALPGQALHARILGFKHPITLKPMHFEAPLPAHLVNLHQALEGIEP